MGVNISDLVVARDLEPKDLIGRTVAIDAYNAIYQFLSVIRQPDGTPLMDPRGRVTSHLEGLLNRNANLVEMGIRPAYVFDGISPDRKEATIKERRVRREKAKSDWEKAKEEGDVHRAYSKATQSTRITNEIVESSRILLTHLGIPVVQAPEEGEAQAAYMCAKGDVWATASQDFDSLLFGTPRLVRNLTLSGRRKMPGRNEYREVLTQIIDRQETLSTLGIDGRQLIGMCVLMGTDFNPGVMGVGPKKALKLIKQHGTMVGALRSLGIDPTGMDEVESIFLSYERTDDYKLQWTQPDKAKVMDMLCGDHGFTEKRVNGALDKFASGKKDQKRLDMF
ncbi:MAG: flap endonuclease-1 [Methanomassiliicoccales archaeon]|nr:flap endonuclease-1 [Methanomassiliicoccales archaeon]